MEMRQGNRGDKIDDLSLSMIAALEAHLNSKSFVAFLQWLRSRFIRIRSPELR